MSIKLTSARFRWAFGSGCADSRRSSWRSTSPPLRPRRGLRAGGFDIELAAEQIGRGHTKRIERLIEEAEAAAGRSPSRSEDD